MDENNGNMENKNESFTRWQGYTIQELGKATNLLLSLCLATIGFVLSMLLNENFKFNNCCCKTLLILGTIILLLCTLTLLALMYNRLFSFRNTTQIARE